MTARDPNRRRLMRVAAAPIKIREGTMMLEFLMANLGNIFVGALLVLILALIIMNLIGKKKKGQSTCGCGCSNCPSAGMCHKQ